METKAKKSPVFMIIGIVTFIVGLITPRLFVTFFALVVIVCCVISLIRSEKPALLSILVLLGGGWLLISPLYQDVKKDELKKEVKYQLAIVNWTWERDGNYTYIKGRVKNNSTYTISYFAVTASYKDENGNVLDTDYTNSGENLLPGNSKEFEIMHEYSKEYRNVSIAVTEVNILDQY
jgi:hypothetical protein